MIHFRACAAVFIAVICAPLARADITVVSQTTVEGLPSQVANRVRQGMTSKTFYKEGKVRTEMGDSVSITEGDRIYLVRPGEKTYSVTSLGKMGETINPFVALFDPKVNVDVNPGGKVRTILGKRARNFLFVMTMKLSVRPDALSSGAKSKPQEIPTVVVVVQGEQWVTEEIALTKMPNVASSMGFIRGLAMMAGQKEMVEKFAQVKGLPLLMTMTETFQGGAGLPNVPDHPITAKMKVTSIQEGALAASLFTVPKGFKQVPFTSVTAIRLAAPGDAR